MGRITGGGVGLRLGRDGSFDQSTGVPEFFGGGFQFGGGKVISADTLACVVMGGGSVKLCRRKLKLSARDFNRLPQLATFRFIHAADNDMAR